MTFLSFVDFRQEHLDLIDPTEARAKQRMVGAGAMLENQIFAVTAFRGSDCVGCGGLSPIHAGRCVAWAVVSKSAPAVTVTRLVQAFLQQQDIPRIEAVVDADDAKCQRWVRMLGFAQESGRLRKFNQDGTDVILFARVNHGA